MADVFKLNFIRHYFPPFLMIIFFSLAAVFYLLLGLFLVYEFPRIESIIQTGTSYQGVEPGSRGTFCSEFFTQTSEQLLAYFRFN